jgi:hypothetical protein
MAYTNHQKQLRAAKQATVASKASKVAKIVQRIQGKVGDTHDAKPLARLKVRATRVADAQHQAGKTRSTGALAAAADDAVTVELLRQADAQGTVPALAPTLADKALRTEPKGQLVGVPSTPMHQPAMGIQGNTMGADQGRLSATMDRHPDGRFKADVSRHNRRGEPGEWSEVFQEVHREAFKQRYGALVEGLGYVQGDGW